MDITISYQYDTEQDALEAETRGYRCDVVVTVGERKYELFIMTMIRLQQVFEISVKDYGYYWPKRNMVIVNESTKAEIENTIKKLAQGGFFNDGAGYFFPIE